MVGIDPNARAADVASRNWSAPERSWFQVELSARLYIGPAKQAPSWSIAAYDPATGQLTGIRPGSVQFGVTVNNVTKSTSIEVTR